MNRKALHLDDPDLLSHPFGVAREGTQIKITEDRKIKIKKLFVLLQKVGVANNARSVALPS